MYPYESRLKWLLSSRYNHLLRALEMTPHPRDSVLIERSASLRRWDRVRAGVTLLLYLGFASTAVGIARNYAPGLATAAPLVAAATRVVGTLTGLLTLAYLLVTRLLGQIEADILMILTSNGKQ